MVRLLVVAHVLIVLLSWAKHASGAQGFVNDTLSCQNLILLVIAYIIGLAVHSHVSHVLVAFHGVCRHYVRSCDFLEFVFVHIHLDFVEFLCCLVCWHATSRPS